MKGKILQNVYKILRKNMNIFHDFLSIASYEYNILQYKPQSCLYTVYTLNWINIITVTSDFRPGQWDCADTTWNANDQANLSSRHPNF